jgi:hypothetical protein
VNGIPGWQGLQAATGVDVAGTIVQQLEARVAGRRDLAAEHACLAEALARRRVHA